MGLWAVGMNGPGQNFLAGTAFAQQQDGGVAGSGAKSGIQLSAEGGVERLQIGLGDDGANLLFQHIDLNLQTTQVANLADHDAKLIGRHRLDEVVGGSPPHRLDGTFDRAKRGEDNHLQVGGQSQHFGQQIEAMLASQADVEKRHLEGSLAQESQGLITILDIGDGMAHRLQCDSHRAADVWLVVDDEDVERGNFSCFARPILQIAKRRQNSFRGRLTQSLVWHGAAIPVRSGHADCKRVCHKTVQTRSQTFAMQTAARAAAKLNAGSGLKSSTVHEPHPVHLSHPGRGAHFHVVELLDSRVIARWVGMLRRAVCVCAHVRPGLNDGGIGTRQQRAMQTAGVPAALGIWLTASSKQQQELET